MWRRLAREASSVARSNARTVDEYLAELPPERQDGIAKTIARAAVDGFIELYEASGSQSRA